MAGDPRVRLPLWLKLTVGAGLLAIVPCVAISLLSLQQSAGSIRAQAREYQLAVTQQVGDKLEIDLGQARNDLNGVAAALTAAQLSDDARIALATLVVASSSELDHAAIYGTDGKLIDRIVKPGTELAPAAPMIDLGAPGFAPGTLGTAVSAGGLVRIPIAAAIMADGKQTGVVVSLVSLDRIQTKVEHLAGDRFPGAPDGLSIIDSDLRTVASSRTDDATALKSRTGQGLLDGLSGNAIANGVAKFGEFASPDGTAMVGTLTPLTRWKMAVLAQQPSDIVYADLYALRRWVLTLSAIAVVLAALAALVFARTLTAPIGKLVEFARALAARKFDGRVVVATRDELSVLGAAMSGAAADLEASEAAIAKEIEIRSDLGRYLPKEVVDKVVAREHDMALGGTRREVSVLFADVVAFTPLAEKLAPETVVAILNELFTILTEIIFRHRGLVDKFIGDSVMAVWGAAEPCPDHAVRAVNAAVDMQRWLELGKRRWQEQHGVDIDIAIGINSGAAVIGNIGSTTRMEFTAIGDTVNIAARLEAIARPKQILITRATRDAVGEEFEVNFAAERELTGRSGNVEIFEVAV